MDRIVILADEELKWNTTYCDSHSLSTLLMIRNTKATIQLAQELESALEKTNDAEYAAVLQKHFKKTVAAFQCGDKETIRRAYARDQDCTVVTEVLDGHTRQVLFDNPAYFMLSEYVVSHEITARMIAMISHRRDLAPIILELLSTDGHEIYCLKASRLVNDNEKASFHEVAARAKKFQITLIGYLLHLEHFPRLNPDNKRQPIAWSTNDTMLAICMANPFE